MNPAEITPLPMAQIICILLLQLCEAININVLFPFLAFMVEDFGYTGHRIGYYAGALAAAFCGAQLTSSIFWGMISDKYGRKPAVICGTIGAGCGMLVFGTAKTFEQAVLGRALSGFLSGNIGVIKSFLTEVTDQTNRPKGFSYLQVAWALGCIIGPLLGGFLCYPVVKYPSIFSSITFLKNYPFLLPCLFCVFLNFFSSLFVIFYMKETNIKVLRKFTLHHNRITGNDINEDENVIVLNNSNMNEDGEDISKPWYYRLYLYIIEKDDTISYSELTGLDMTTHSSHGLVDGDAERSHSTGIGIDSNSGDMEMTIVSSENDDHVMSEVDNCIDRTTSQHNSEPKEVSSESSVPLSEIIKDKGVLFTTLCYGILCFGDVITVECIPLFCKLNIQQGGLNMTSNEIGLTISIGGIMMLFFSTCFLPKILAGSKLRVFRTYNLVSIPVVLLFPILGDVNKYLYSIYDESHYSTIDMVINIVLIILTSLRTIVFTLTFSSIIMLVNHSVEDIHLGTVNGMGQTLASSARSIGPALGGIIWSLSLKYKFVYSNFVITAAVLLFCEYINFQLPNEIDHKKTSSVSHGSGEMDYRDISSSNDNFDDDDDDDDEIILQDHNYDYVVDSNSNSNRSNSHRNDEYSHIELVSESQDEFDIA